MNLNMRQFPLELRLLVLCLRECFSESDTGRIEEFPLGKVNWDAFLWWAHRHRVIPILSKIQQRLEHNGFPDQAIQQVVEGSTKNTLRNLLLASELVHVTDLLERNAIPVIAFKGILQTQLLYSHLQYRLVSDIDLLVPPEGADMAHHVLLDAGYVRVSSYPLLPVIETARKKVVKDSAYLHEESGARVELHWRLSFFPPFRDVDFNRILANAQTVRIGDRQVQTLSNEHMRLFLLFHGTSHAWEILFWLCDVAQMLAGMEVPDVSYILTSATKLGDPRFVVLGLLVSHLILGSQLPEEIRSRAELDSAIPLLTQYVVRCICSENFVHQDFAGKVGRIRYWLALSPKLGYKMAVGLTGPITTGLVAELWERMCRYRMDHQNWTGG